MKIDEINALNEVSSVSPLKNDDHQVVAPSELELTVEGPREKTTFRAGMRRLRTETQPHQRSIQNLHGVNATSVQSSTHVELDQILIKYGNNPDGIPAMLYAVKSNDEQAVKVMLENGASANTRVKQDHGAEYNGMHTPSNAIEYAAAYSTPAMMSLLKSYGASFRAETTWNHGGYKVLLQAPIAIAAAFDNLETFQFLVANGVNPLENIQSFNHWSSQEDTPLFIAARNGSIKVFKHILVTGVDISKLKDELVGQGFAKKADVSVFLLENFGPFPKEVLQIALWNACMHSQFGNVFPGDIQLIKLLLAKGASPFAKGLGFPNVWENLLHQDSNVYPAMTQILEIFLSAGKVPPEALRNGIDIATRRGNLNVVKLLVKFGAVLNPQFTANPLQNSEVYQHPEMVRFLLQSGLPVNKAYDGGMTPLHYASQCNHPKAAESIAILLAAGANIHAANNYGNTPLHLACSISLDNGPVIIKLIQSGANIHALNLHKEKPYHSLSQKKLEVIRAFVENGASFGDVHNSTPIFHQFLWRQDAEEVLEYLIEKNGINVNAKNGGGRTLFHFAVERGNLSLMEMLYKRKADVNAKDGHGHTPLSIAKQVHQELVPWLIDRGANWNPA